VRYLVLVVVLVIERLEFEDENEEDYD